MDDWSIYVGIAMSVVGLGYLVQLARSRNIGNIIVLVVAVLLAFFGLQIIVLSTL